MKQKPLTLYACIDILRTCVKLDIIKADPNNVDNIIIWRTDVVDGKETEGWFSCGLIEEAAELLNDKEGQGTLLSAIREKEPDFTPEIMPWVFMSEYKGDGHLIILTGMSACGKDAVCTALAEDESTDRLISTTTRPMREKEVQDVDYHFVSKERFEQGLQDNAFLEYRAYNTFVDGEAVVWYYGSAKEDINAYKNYVKVLDLNGAKAFIDYYGSETCCVVNIQADDEVRRGWAAKRGSFDEAEWNKRLADDKEHFNEEAVNAVANCIVKCGTRSLEEVITAVKEATTLYYKIKDEKPEADIIIKEINGEWQAKERGTQK